MTTKLAQALRSEACLHNEYVKTLMVSAAKAIERHEATMRAQAGALIIHASETGAPIPIRTCDWAAHEDGQEERGSGLGATKWDAVRALIDMMEAEDE